MALIIGDNFSYKGRKPLDARIVVSTLDDLLAIPSSTIYDGILVYVIENQKFYTYDSNNDTDPTLQKWTELKASSYTIQSARIDNVPESSTYQHLLLTLNDDPTNPTVIDCGVAVGPQGEKGQGFAIVKLYTSVDDMVADSNPVDNGQMVAVVYTDEITSDLVAKVYIRNTEQTHDDSGNEDGYTYFCNISDATAIQGPKGETGPRGYTPIASVSTIAPTSTTPAGSKVTFTFGPGTSTELIGALAKNNTYNLLYTNIEPSSLTITDGDNTYTSDDSGNILLESDIVATINYTTGVLTNGNIVNFINASVTYDYENTSEYSLFNGLSVKSATIRNSDSHLILTLTDDTELDAGLLSQGGHLFVTQLPTTNILKGTEYILMGDLADETTYVGTYVYSEDISDWIETSNADIPLASKTVAGKVRINNLYDININEDGDLYPSLLTKQQYDNKSSYSFIGKGTLENVLTAKFPNKTALDNVSNSGLGDKFLNDAGEYVEVQGGGTGDYNDLENKPQINSTTLSGNVTTSDLDLISTDTNNAIYSGEDGNLFVEDKTNDIARVEAKANRINIAQKTVNRDLGYYFAQLEETTPTLKVGDLVNKYFTNIDTNFEELSETDDILLKAGKRYKITAWLVSVDQSVGMMHQIINTTDDSILGTGAMNDSVGRTPAVAIVYPEEDMYVNVKVNIADPGKPAHFLEGQSDSFILVEEMPTMITIDPVEHVNETTGIEDTPVGHIMAYMGTDAPAHYLVADGSVYNIVDYPYLAQWIIDNYESVNYFGGDGVTTFSIPNLMNKFLKGSTNVGVAEEAGLPAITGTASTRAVVYGSDGTGALTGTKYTSEVANQGFGSGTYFRSASGLGAFGINLDASKSSEIYGKSTTVTPENMSVLWCIKYEPTYFMQTKYAAGWNGELTQEHWTGEYFNNEPVYEKVISLNNVVLPKATTAIATITGVADVIDLNFIYSSSGSFVSMPANGAIYPLFSPSNGTVSVANTGNQVTLDNIKATIKYTKTS